MTKYKVVRPNQLVVGIHIDEGALGVSGDLQVGIVSPAYNLWDIQPEVSIDPTYLDRFIRSPRAIQYFIANYRKTADRRGKLTRERFLELPVPLPPIEEQRRIAAVLDAADELRTKRRQALAKLDTLTQAIFIDMFGDPARNSKGLPALALGELGDWRSGGTPPRSNKNHFVGEIPWFSSGDLESEFLTDSSEHVNQEAIDSTSAKEIPVGSLLLGMYDTAALKSGVTTRPSSCNQAVAFSRLDDSRVSTRYVYAAIQLGREHFKRTQRGIRQKNLNLTMVREIRIPLPPLHAQREFDDRLVKIDELRSEVSVTVSRLDTLFASLQQRAFAGEL